MAEAAIAQTQAEPAPEVPEVAPVAGQSMIGSATADANPEAAPATTDAAAPAEAKSVVEPAAFDPGAWKAPEGMKVDEGMMKEFADIINAKDLKGQDRGGKLLGLYQKAMETSVQRVTESNTKAWADTIGQWERVIKADPEIGGDRLQPALQSIARTLDLLGPEGSAAFKQAMTVTGAGSHPAVVKGMALIAGILTEGGHIPGSPGGGKDKSLSQLFFPNSPDMQGET